jgi:hypothetical protein
MGLKLEGLRVLSTCPFSCSLVAPVVVDGSQASQREENTWKLMPVRRSNRSMSTKEKKKMFGRNRTRQQLDDGSFGGVAQS